MADIAKVFSTGNSQAVRLPMAYRVQAREMWISKNPHTGEITLRPKTRADELEAFVAALQRMPASAEFLIAREDAHRPDALEGWLP